MTIRITSGASDFVDGEALSHTDLNQTLDAGRTHRAIITDATEYTEDGTSFATQATYTLTPGTSQNILLGWRFKCEIKQGGAGIAYVKLYQNNRTSPEYGRDADSYGDTGYFYMRPGTTWSSGSTGSWGGTGALTNADQMNQTSYDFLIQTKHSVGGDATNSAYIQNVELEICWVEYPSLSNSQLA